MYCKCGCGQKTKIAIKTRSSCGHLKGEPIDYIHGHNRKGDREDTVDCRRSFVKNGIKKTEARWIVEQIIGYELPLQARVHHVDGNMHNNTPSNLVVCENEEYHRLLHIRQRALKECGNANFRKCCLCKQYDDPANLYKAASSTSYAHMKCKNSYNQQIRKTFYIPAEADRIKQNLLRWLEI